MRSLRLALLCGALFLCLAAPAAASRTQESIFEDEHQLLELGPGVANRSLDDIQTLGADSVRSLVLWSRLAPRGGKRPAGFKAADPRAYPPSAWDPYDDLVRGAGVRGLGLILSPSTPGPAWASRCRRKKGTCKPDPKAYRAFVTALGVRYSGTYADENQGGGVLPRVTRWSLGNEPNQPGWLTPQYERKRGHLIATAAVVYRALARAGIAGLRASGHGRDQILLGETSPIGRTSGSLAKRPIPPLEFLRKLFCLTPGGKRLRGADGRRHGCAKFKKLAVTGFAHHPYQRGGSRPPAEPPQASGEITISSPSRLHRVLDQAGRTGRIPRRLPIYYTEFGFQTNPPDRIFGVRIGLQPQYINQSDWMASRDRGCGRCRSTSWSTRRRWRASSPGCGSSTGARSRPTPRTGCRSGSAGAARGCACTARCARPRTGRRRSSRSSSGRARAGRSRPSRRSRCARATASS